MTLPIKELRAKAEVATPGPWEHFRDPDYERDAVVRDSDENELLELGLSENMEADAAFIAATNPATVLALLDRIVTLTALAGEACDLAMNERWTSKPVEYRAEMVRRIHEIRAELAGKERGE